MEEVLSALKILTSNPTGRRPLARSRCRWEDNIRMDLKEIGLIARFYEKMRFLRTNVYLHMFT